MRPKHVALLDYEIELALVFRRAIVSPATVTREKLKEYVFGIAIANDFSARDVQLPQTQFLKGKSYRGFCPLGPWLTVLEDDEFNLLTPGARARGKRRDKATRFHPEPRLQAGRNNLGAFDFRQYCAGRRALDRHAEWLCVRVPPPAIRRIVQLLPEGQFWKLFLKSQSRRPQYLRHGDSISARIVSADGRLDLGEQRTEVLAEA